MNNQLDPSHIMQTATAFWPSKVLLTAVELDLFTTLGDGQQTAAQLGKAVGLHPRGTYDFFDALVALKFLERDGDGPEGKYRNTPETAAFLNKKSLAYIGGLAGMLNSRLFGFWNNLGTALKTGKPQNENKQGGKSIFEELYANPDTLAEGTSSKTTCPRRMSSLWGIFSMTGILRTKRCSSGRRTRPCRRAGHLSRSRM